jgi:hypothetical protein
MHIEFADVAQITHAAAADYHVPELPMSQWQICFFGAVGAAAAITSRHSEQ